jgi:predicted ArsR family transcriptional regulator
MANPPPEPEPFLLVTDPDQLKAFTDPLRDRVLHLLARQPATNQQIAHLLEQPQARVLHHVRYLLACRLIRLVETRVKGGNVEKYYRAVARGFGLRPPTAELASELMTSTVDSVSQEVAASLVLWPGQRSFETRTARLKPARLEDFQTKLQSLLREYWEDPSGEDPEAPLQAFVALRYRHPSDR